MSRQGPDAVTLSQKIIANIRTKNAKIKHNTPGIADGGIHFDWYFPNLYPNSNVNTDQDTGIINITSNIIYDQALINYLILDKKYYRDYLGLTGKYFRSIGIDFTRKDESKDNVDYATAQGYKVRLNKIIQSYKILMWGCKQYFDNFKNREDVPRDLAHIPDFYEQLQKRYKRILKAFWKNNKEFIKESSEPDSYGLYSLANCFEDGYRNKKKESHIVAIQSRAIYYDVFCNPFAPHKQIERDARNESLHQSDQARRSAPISPKSTSKNTLMRINPIVGNIEAVGRVMQYAKVTLTDRDEGIPATIIKPILSRQFNGENNFWHNHQSPRDGYRRGNDYLVLNKDYKQPDGPIDIRAIEKIMAKVISNCQKHLGMNCDEVMQAIILAKKYGGLGNAAEGSLLCDPLLTGVAGGQDPQAMLDKFRKFSFLVQRFNEDNGIYSGRKNGKLVGLRLTFVSENAISLWQENSRAIEDRGGGAAGGPPPGRAGGAGR